MKPFQTPIIHNTKETIDKGIGIMGVVMLTLVKMVNMTFQTNTTAEAIANSNLDSSIPLGPSAISNIIGKNTPNPVASQAPRRGVLNNFCTKV